MNNAAIARRRRWKEKIEIWQSSGKTITAWCKENNVPYSTFQCWRKQLGLTSKKNESEQSSFLELQEENSSDPGIQLHLKGVSISLPEKFNEETLVRCLQVLRGL